MKWVLLEHKKNIYETVLLVKIIHNSKDSLKKYENYKNNFVSLIV